MMSLALASICFGQARKPLMAIDCTFYGNVDFKNYACPASPTRKLLLKKSYHSFDLRSLIVTSDKTDSFIVTTPLSKKAGSKFGAGASFINVMITAAVSVPLLRFQP
jgi:hypothetical protein